MNQRIASFLGFAGTVAAASVAAALMTGNALAEGPIEVQKPFVGTLTRAEVRAEVMRDRAQLTSYVNEFALYLGSFRPTSDYTPAQARAEYIAARDEVRVMNSEAGSSGHATMARAARPASTLIAAGER
ncbi:MAG TPA: hypothetical protein VF522_15030 [Ramlibacter sp.]|uniref:hypothetical protein n=1 Tax=Ramlibacter sp. TaxID=1917967 RepID=UPI002ED3BB41